MTERRSSPARQDASSRVLLHHSLAFPAQQPVLDPSTFLPSCWEDLPHFFHTSALFSARQFHHLVLHLFPLCSKVALCHHPSQQPRQTPHFCPFTGLNHIPSRALQHPPPDALRALQHPSPFLQITQHEQTPYSYKAHPRVASARASPFVSF